LTIAGFVASFVIFAIDIVTTIDVAFAALVVSGVVVSIR